MMDRCNVCGGSLRSIAAYAALPRVSSDCKPVAPGGSVAACSACGGIQKPVTSAFLADIGVIYAKYDVYYQGGGMEQIVFDSRKGAPSRRSELLSDRLLSTDLLPAKGSVVDLGCGNGAFLASLAARLPGWSLAGLELDRKHEATLARIPRFERLIVGEPEALSGSFDLISMIHALEHFTDPLRTLTAIRARLTPQGLLFIEIPNVEQNPFDLLIADHVSHMTPWTLETLLARAGFEVVHLATDWVGKELSVLARPAPSPPASSQRPPSLELCGSAIGWLSATLEAARGAAEASSFGLFGTSIASTWLSGALGDRIQFYLDEDTSRQGQNFFGKPVLAPAAAPDGSTVFVGLAPVIAAVVAKRLSQHRIRVVMPPTLAAG